MTTDKRLYNVVARQIVEMIDTGQFPAGSRLPGERDLAKLLNVSRVTVREAQIALQALGRIEVRSGSGAKVLPPPTSSDNLPEMGALELTEARALFESEAAALAASNITQDELEILDGLVESMSGDFHDEALHLQSDREFHLTIASATKNEAIIDTVERLWRFRTEIDEIRHAYESICSIEPEARLKEHRDVVDALRERNPAKARTAMRRHFACIAEVMLSSAEEKAIEAARRRTTEARARFLDSAALIQ